MNALLLVAHAPLASALRDCALHVWPDCGAHIAAVDVLANADPTQSLEQAEQALHVLIENAQATGCLVMSDVFGGTPSNVAEHLIERCGQKVFASPSDAAQAPQQAKVPLALMSGVSLPMLLRSLCYRHEDLSSLCQRAVEGAKAGMVLKFPTS